MFNIHSHNITYITNIHAALYSGNFSVKTAPTTLKNALDRYDIERANTKFGFAKDQVYNQNVPPTNDSGAVSKNLETTQVTRHATTATATATATARNNCRDPLANRSSTINESANIGAAPNVPSRPIQTIPLPTNTNSSRQVATAILTASGNPSSQQQQRASSGPSNAMQHGPPILPPSTTSNNNNNNYNYSQIGPPPTPTDALRNSVLFSQQPRPPAPTAHLAATGIPGDGTTHAFASNSRHCNPPTVRVSTDIPKISFATNHSSSQGRLSLGQTPIRQAPLVTPSTSNTNNPTSGGNGKRPNDSAGGPYNNDLDGHKRQRNVNNPYMAT
jgi:hypothetical protein